MSKEQKNLNNEPNSIQQLADVIKDLVKKPKSVEEQMIDVKANFDSKADQRAILKEKIEKRRMEILNLGKGHTFDDAMMLESWERLIVQYRSTDPSFAQDLQLRYNHLMKNPTK
jgi:hypothetical protein